MEISDIRIKLIQDSSDRLKAVCSITLDDEFVVRDLKVVEGTNGLFVAMPSRKLSVHCPQCRGKNHLRARFCNECGAKLPPARTTGDAAGRPRMHRDIAHPINPTFREIVQSRVIEKYRAESELAKNPDYAPIDIDADYEEKVVETQEESETRYAPSEYDQLIAGLNKGASSEPTEVREHRSSPHTASPRAPRPNDHGRSGQNVRTARPTRNMPPRQTPRTDVRPTEPSRVSRNQNSNVRPAPPPPPTISAPIEDEDIPEVNGNVAAPDQPIKAGPRRGTSPPPRRTNERPSPRRVEERPVPRRNEETKEERRSEEPAARVVEAPPVQQPAPVVPKQKPAKLEDLPFGAGL